MTASKVYDEVGMKRLDPLPNHCTNISFYKKSPSVGG